MIIENFTEKSQQALQEAQETAVRYGHQQVDGEHIHYALVRQEDGLIPRLLEYMNVNVRLYESDLERQLDRIPRVEGAGVESLYATRRFNGILVYAQDEARKFKDEYVGVEHLYLALLKERGTP